MTRVLQIKNMVCPRCISAVEGLVGQMNLEQESIKLGELRLNEALSSAQQKALKEGLEQLGFELLDDKKSALVNRIKTLIIETVHQQEGGPQANFSDQIAAALHQDYTVLSRLFSSVEGMTIERYIALQRIEKIKELLIYDQMSLAEIADQLGLSSAAYVSNFFKKETGMTPSRFNKEQPRRKSLDQI